MKWNDDVNKDGTAVFRDDLIVGVQYGGITFLDGMERFKGETVIITNSDITLFNIKGSFFCFSKEMLK